MQIWHRTDRGKVREENEDYSLYELAKGDSRAAAVLCDGMGGAAAGNVASRIAAERIQEILNDALPHRLNATGMRDHLRLAISEANAAVFKAAEEHPEYAGMGTTAVALLANEELAVLANVGDSRAYHLSEEGILRITDDHSLVEEMYRRGELTREEARAYPGKNFITRAIGTEPQVECDLFEVQLYADDCILICSDGLTNVVDEQEILYEVMNGQETEKSCDRLIEIALSRGAPDNVSVLLLKI